MESTHQGDSVQGHQEYWSISANSRIHMGRQLQEHASTVPSHRCSTTNILLLGLVPAGTHDRSQQDSPNIAAKGPDSSNEKDNRSIQGYIHSSPRHRSIPFTNNLRLGEMSALSCFRAKRGPVGFGVASSGKVPSIAPPAAFSKI